MFLFWSFQNLPFLQLSPVCCHHFPSLDLHIHQHTCSSFPHYLLWFTCHVALVLCQVFYCAFLPKRSSSSLPYFMTSVCFWTFLRQLLSPLDSSASPCFDHWPSENCLNSTCSACDLSFWVQTWRGLSCVCTVSWGLMLLLRSCSHCNDGLFLYQSTHGFKIPWNNTLTFFVSVSLVTNPYQCTCKPN